MVRSTIHAMTLALLAATIGCAALGSRRDGGSFPAASAHRPSPAAKPAATTETAALPPLPEHAPALYIPGPAHGAEAAPRSIQPSSARQIPDDDGATLPALKPSTPGASDQPLHALHRKAVARWAAIDDYGCRLRRREVVNGKARPEEVIAAKFRKEPFSVYFVWTGAEAKGRELIYVKGQHGNLMHTLTAAGDVPLLPGGQRFKVSPDNMLVKASSRYSITEAGVGPLIDQFGKLIDGLDRRDPRAGLAKYLGLIKRPDFDHDVEVVLQKIPTGCEASLPDGGQRLWCFDPAHGLPVLTVTQDVTGREMDYCCFDRFEFPGRYPDETFHPDHLGKSGSR